MLTPWTGSVYRPLNNAGRREPGGTFTFYRTGTRILKDVYQEAARSTTHDNPLTLDDEGGALIFLDSDEAYDVVFKGANGQLIWTLEGVVGDSLPAPE